MNSKQKNTQDKFEILRKIQLNPQSSQRAMAEELGSNYG